MALPLEHCDKTIRINGWDLYHFAVDDYPLYRDFHARATPSDLTFYSSFPALMRGGYAWQIIDGFLFTFMINPNRGRPYVDVLNLPRNTAGEFLHAADTREILERINGNRRGFIMSIHPDLLATHGIPGGCPLRSVIGREYVYDNRLLSAVEGGEFRNLRKNAGRFGKRVNFEIVPYQRSMRAHANKVYNEWCASRGLKYETIWDRDMYASLLDCHGMIDHMLYMVLDKDSNEYVGFFDAVPVNATLAVGVFRKLSVRYKGIAEYCQIHLARELAARGITYLNDGDDCYEPGLKALKEKFHPVMCFTPMQYEF